MNQTIASISINIISNFIYDPAKSVLRTGATLIEMALDGTAAA